MMKTKIIKSKIPKNKIVDTIPLMEQFYSVQGEGLHSGRPAVFIRLAGCDVGCVWCDVKESWDANEHKNVSISEIVNFVNETNCKFVVITGGEPAMYNLEELTSQLKSIGCEIAIETSGVYPLTGTIDWVCFSPKKFKAPDESIYAKANELKVIVFNNHDLKWAQEHANKVRTTCKLYLQPEWDKRDEMSEKIIEFVKLNPKWNISLQTHKYLQIP